MTYMLPADQAASVRDVHPSHRQAHVTPVNAPLHVVVGLSNPMRYASRYRLFNAFRKYVADSGALLTTVELALGDRHFEVTSHHNPHDVQVRSKSLLWHKENLLNVGIRHLPADWQYVAWIDSDVVFSRPDWATEAVHLLQTYDVVQLWTHALDMGPDGQPIAQYQSFFSSWQQDELILQPWDRKRQQAGPKPTFKIDHRHRHCRGHHCHCGSEVHLPTGPDGSTDAGSGPGQPAANTLHTGYAFAARRDALDALGGLGDIGVLGSGDRHMAYALVGEADKSYPAGIHPNYRAYWSAWQARAERHVRRNVGVMSSTLVHHWHGSKQHRRYADRWQILLKDGYDPAMDVFHDTQGVLQWSGTNQKLARDVRQYFSLRSEDSIDL